MIRTFTVARYSIFACGSLRFDICMSTQDYISELCSRSPIIVGMYTPSATLSSV